MGPFHLAQLNVARLLHPLDHPALASFVDNLAPVNASADAANGFVWRLQEESGDATGLRPFGDDMIVNLSVWDDLESLRGYVFGNAHSAILRRRREYFVPMDQPHVVVWWVPFGHRPDAGRGTRAARPPRGARPDAVRVHAAHGLPARRGVSA